MLVGDTASCVSFVTSVKS